MRAAYIPEDRLKRIREKLSRQDRLIMDICLETGGRIDDVLALRRWQVNGDSIDLLESKTNQRRVCSISEQLKISLEKQVANKGNLAYVFYGRQRKRNRRKPHRTTFWRHMVMAAEELGYGECQYTPHSLRKVFAVRTLHKTRSLEQTRKIMGHKYVTTTMLYALSDRQEELGLY